MMKLKLIIGLLLPLICGYHLYFQRLLLPYFLFFGVIIMSYFLVGLNITLIRKVFPEIC